MNLTEMRKSSDFSGGYLLISNLVSIVLAIVFSWELFHLLIVYWFQSVAIGISNFFRMLRLRDFCTEGFTSNGRPVPETKAGKISTALFFAVHYGFFHIGYLVFIVAGLGSSEAPEVVEEPSRWEGIFFWVAIASFAFSHWKSFRVNVDADLRRRPNIGSMMFLPYARIVPMHLTIILGAALPSSLWALLLFMSLKTGADYLMHIVEHRWLQQSLENDDSA